MVASHFYRSFARRFLRPEARCHNACEQQRSRHRERWRAHHCPGKVSPRERDQTQASAREGDGFYSAARTLRYRLLRLDPHVLPRRACCACRGISNLILAPTGLGHLWIVDAPRHRIYRSLVRLVVGRYLNSPKTTYVFENPDDPLELCLEPKAPNVVILNGAGVDEQQFQALDDPGGDLIKVASSLE